MRDEVADGWKISQVESLVGLPRRDIQRACYEGAGGLGIVKPRNTTWGWRVYEVPDVAKLFLLAQGRRQGKTFDEVRDELASCEGARDVLRRLARCEQAAREACDAHAGASWIGYTELDSFERVASSRRGPWPTRSTPGISPTSSSGR